MCTSCACVALPAGRELRARAVSALCSTAHSHLIRAILHDTCAAHVSRHLGAVAPRLAAPGREHAQPPRGPHMQCKHQEPMSQRLDCIWKHVLAVARAISVAAQRSSPMRARAQRTERALQPVRASKRDHTFETWTLNVCAPCSSARSLVLRCKVGYLASMGGAWATMWLLLGLNGRSERYSQYALLSAITPLKHGLLMYVTHVRLIIVSKYFIFQCFAIM